MDKFKMNEKEEEKYFVEIIDSIKELTLGIKQIHQESIEIFKFLDERIKKLEDKMRLIWTGRKY